MVEYAFRASFESENLSIGDVSLLMQLIKEAVLQEMKMRANNIKVVQVFEEEAERVSAH